VADVAKVTVTRSTTTGGTGAARTSTAKAAPATRATPAKVIPAKVIPAKATSGKAATARTATGKTATVTAATGKTTSTKTASPKSPALAPSDPPTRGHTASKKELGQSTPKRKVIGRVVEAPPANRREALKRSRAKERAFRAEQRAGMMEGKEEFLLPRDKGPERALVRDIVDARRTLATYFIPVAFVVMLAPTALPKTMEYAANLLWALLAVGVVVDSYLLSRVVRRKLTERFPDNPLQPRRYYFYAISRSLSMRRMRMPKARVKVGEAV
jgi:hypothetical protein